LSANETKRKDNPLTKRVIILGFLLGTLYTFLGIYLSYKVGIVALGGIFLLGYILLQLTGKYNYKENVILIIIVTSCLLPAFEISDNIAALVIYKDHLNQPIDLSFPLLFLLSAVGSILGIFLLMPFKSQFLKLKWPMVQPSAQMVKAIGGTLKERIWAFGSMIVSSLIAFVTTISGFKTLALSLLPFFHLFNRFCSIVIWSSLLSEHLVLSRRRKIRCSFFDAYYASINLLVCNRSNGNNSSDGHSEKSSCICRCLSQSNEEGTRRRQKLNSFMANSSFNDPASSGDNSHVISSPWISSNCDIRNILHCNYGGANRFSSCLLRCYVLGRNRICNKLSRRHGLSSHSFSLRFLF